MESVTKKKRKNFDIEIFNYPPIYENILKHLPFISQLSLVRVVGYPRGDSMYTRFRYLLCLALRKEGIDDVKFMNLVDRNKVTLGGPFIMDVLVGYNLFGKPSALHGTNSIVSLYSGYKIQPFKSGDLDIWNVDSMNYQDMFSDTQFICTYKRLLKYVRGKAIMDKCIIELRESGFAYADLQQTHNEFKISY